MVTIEESGLVFGPFRASHLFQVETSEHVQHREGIKACEFVWWNEQKAKLVLVEAKSSIPDPKRSPDEYATFWQKVHDKFDNAMQLLLLGALGRPETLRAELPATMQALPWPSLHPVLYLVIPDAPDAFLVGLTDRLREQMGRQQRLWQAELFVINADRARAKRLLAVPPGEGAGPEGRHGPGD